MDLCRLRDDTKILSKISRSSFSALGVDAVVAVNNCLDMDTGVNIVNIVGSVWKACKREVVEMEMPVDFMRGRKGILIERMQLQIK